MTRKIIALALILVLAIGTTAIATASTGETGAGIKFEEGTIIIVPPGDDCCHCYGDDPCGIGPGCTEEPTCKPGDSGKCECPCHDFPIIQPPYRDFEFSDNLYFGTHRTSVFGRFDSRPTGAGHGTLAGRNTTNVDNFTGVEVINGKASPQQVVLEVSEFEIAGETTLDGAVLRLVAHERIQNGDYAHSFGPGFYQAGTTGDGVEIPLEGDGAVRMLTVRNSSMIKASWYGLLNTNQGTAEEGEATATLTWTAQDVPVTPDP